MLSFAALAIQPYLGQIYINMKVFEIMYFRNGFLLPILDAYCQINYQVMCYYI